MVLSPAEFAAAFRDRAKSQRAKIGADIEFRPAQAAQAQCLDDIAKKIAKLPKGTIIVFGTQYAETPAMLRGCAINWDRSPAWATRR